MKIQLNARLSKDLRSAVNDSQNNRKTSNNQFHNFKQRDTDYDALMLQNVKEWMDSPK